MPASRICKVSAKNNNKRPSMIFLTKISHYWFTCILKWYIFNDFYVKNPPDDFLENRSQWRWGTVKKIKPEIHGLVPINQELVFKYQVISTKREVFMGWFMNTIYWFWNTYFWLSEMQLLTIGVFNLRIGIDSSFYMAIW